MSDANSKRAVAYLRVSSISQVDGHSLNAQERLFNQLCESRGWAVVRVYREEGQSAHSESVKKRPICPPTDGGRQEGSIRYRRSPYP